MTKPLSENERSLSNIADAVGQVIEGNRRREKNIIGEKAGARDGQRKDEWKEIRSFLEKAG